MSLLTDWTLRYSPTAIGNGLEEQLNEVKQQRPELKLIVIDTLQKVRGEGESSYHSDYKELSSLKALADTLMLAVVLNLSIILDTFLSNRKR